MGGVWERMIGMVMRILLDSITKQVNRMAQRLELAYPPRVLREIMVHGPKVSTPTFVKGGAGSRRYSGKSDIIRGGYANSKRWAILFTCLVTRAVHIELVEEMSSSAFIKAVKRFTAIRGEVNSAHVGRMWRIENPGCPGIGEITFDWPVFHVDRDHF
jgi:hypothetical protein